MKKSSRRTPSRAEELIEALVVSQGDELSAQESRLAVFRAVEADKAERRESYARMLTLWDSWSDVCAAYGRSSAAAQRVVDFLQELVKLLEHIQPGATEQLISEPNRFESQLSRTFVSLLHEVQNGRIADVKKALKCASPRPQLINAEEIKDRLVETSHLRPAPEIELAPREAVIGGSYSGQSELFGFQSQEDYEMAKWLYDREFEKVSGKLRQADLVEILKKLCKEKNWTFYRSRDKHKSLIREYIRRTGAETPSKNKGGRRPA